MSGVVFRKWCHLAIKALLLAACPLVTHAQIYVFSDAEVPENKSLKTMYAFYVYSHQDAPERVGSPFIKFHSLASHIVPGAGRRSAEHFRDYEGIQLSILPYEHFWNMLKVEKFCTDATDVNNGLASKTDQLLVHKLPNAGEDKMMYSYTVKVQVENHQPAPDVPWVVRETGVYILVFSNCGDESAFTVTGSVIVKNSYGFLPGNEYHKMPFYGWLSLGYVGLALLWMALSFKSWRTLFHIHYCIAIVLLLGLVEAFLQWIFFTDWNRSGVRGRFLFIMSILASVVKSIFSYMLVLVAAMGWGVTRPYLDQRSIMKVQAVSFLYIIMDFIRESVLSFRHSHSLSITFVLLCLLPVALLNGAIFYWIFTALSTLMETLKERRQTEKFVLFSRLWNILVIALAIASCTLLFQIFDLSRSISIRWHYQWFLADGMSHLLFVFVLGCMMYLWAPHANSQRYAYSQQVDDDDHEEGKNAQPPWVDEDGLEEDGEDESFWATTHKPTEGEATKKTAVAPQKIGSELGA